MDITLENLRKYGEIVEKLPDSKRIYRIIKAHQAKNYDGTSAGFLPGTPEGEREIIEQEKICGRKRSFSNWW